MSETGKQVSESKSCAAPRNGKQVRMHHIATGIIWEGDAIKTCEPGDRPDNHS
jgi:hypothetical protein